MAQSIDLHENIINAVLSQDIHSLQYYSLLGINLNNIRDAWGDSLLHIAIFYEKSSSFRFLLNLGLDVDVTSLYGNNTPLNMAATFGNLDYVQLLIEAGANPNTQNNHGFTPLNNAVFFENFDVAHYLLSLPQTDVNIPNIFGDIPILWADSDDNGDLVNAIMAHPQFDATYTYVIAQSFFEPELAQQIIDNGHEVDESMASLYDQVVLFGLKYDISGEFSLNRLSSHGSDYTFEFDGYYNKLGIKAIDASFSQFYDYATNHVALSPSLLNVFESVYSAVTFSAQIPDAQSIFNTLMQGKLVILPSGWDRHSIGIVIHEDKLYRCNRGDMSDGVHGIEAFTISHPENLTPELIQRILDGDGSPYFMLDELPEILGLEKIGEIENPTQIAGNCVWTSLETAVEAAFISHFSSAGMDPDSAHSLSKELFLLWEDYEMDVILQDIILHPEPFIQNGVYDDLLISVLESHHDANNVNDVEHGAIILGEWHQPGVFEQFNQKIGQYVIQYDPSAPDYLDCLKPYQSPEYSNILTPLLGDYEIILAKEYLDFLVASESYQHQHPELKIHYNDVIHTSVDVTLTNLSANESTWLSASNSPVAIETHYSLPPLAVHIATIEEHVISV